MTGNPGSGTSMGLECLSDVACNVDFKVGKTKNIDIQLSGSYNQSDQPISFVAFLIKIWHY